MNKLKTSVVLSGVLMALSQHVIAKDMGTWGDVWPVQEQSFLALIQDRLQGLKDNGQLADLQQQFKDRVVAHTLRPSPVPGLVTDTQVHTSWYDPTFVVGQDLADAQGRVFAHRGERLNPLDTLPLNTTLYFIDGDDDRQVAWMKAQTPPTPTYKVILVNGNIKSAADALSERIYFDQQGVLTKKLGIHYIPAMVSQDGKRLKINSIPMKEAKP
ncbi:type-F conjugative transfer system protein TraW [Klebsiella aerogenes]|uniref:type-F conjugative transfer system protein TraW n=1 Tax=Klebsiella aerogenes TaxID=548 RepID=UPI0007BE9795|nr:type-F conjugative transfer system protein TraW [Klebsiella aerogenes]ELS5748300.1 type-F conjugative transfer system protein TraW [Klebsiella aerogenes]KZR01954.1 conjugal transfer protein TraW [Klebsiella aerogenes]RNT20922.1 type-F conjugative transfer system protein TraW [Klebsiella aerogenes]